MEKKPKTAPSTERSRRPFGLAYDTLGDEFVRDLAKLCGLPAEGGQLRAILADEERVSAALAGLSGRALILLDLLVEADGEVPIEEISEVARADHGIDASEFRGAVGELMDAGLAVEVLAGVRVTSRERCLVSFDVLRDLLAPRVRGISIPRTPTLEGSAELWTRNLVALLGSVVHLPMRVTQHRDVHRGSAKKLAAIMDWPPDRVIMLIDAAIRDGILARRGGVLAPVLPALLELARGERPLASGADARIANAYLPPGRWVSALGVKRAVAMGMLRDWRKTYSRLQATAERWAVIRHEACRDVDTLPALRVALNGQDYLLRPGPGSRSGHGDGHVTPSFEVMLGPEADVELVASLALCTEPSRIDVVLTRKITPASIAAGCAAGLDAEAIVKALGRVGRHGVPDNVRAMVEEWASVRKTARIHDVWAIEVGSAEIGDAVTRALGADVAARPSPTVVLVHRSTANIAARIQALGVRVPEQLEPLYLLDKKIVWDDPPPVESAYLEGALGNALLRERVEQNAEPDRLRPEGFTPLERLDECLALLPPRAEVARKFLVALRRLWEAGIDDYALWTDKLDPQQRDEALSLPLAEPWVLIAWLVRAPRKRARLLANAKSVDALIVAAQRLDPRDGITTPGAAAIRLGGHPEVRSLVFEAPWPAPQPKGGAAREARPTAAAAKPSPSTPAPARAAPVARAKPKPPPSKLGLRDSAPDHGALKAAFAKAAAEGVRVMLRVRSGSAERLVMVDPEMVAERGNDVALLGFDIDDDVDRAFPLANVLAIEPV